MQELIINYRQLCNILKQKNSAGINIDVNAVLNFPPLKLCMKNLNASSGICENELFENIDFAVQPLPAKVFEQCSFENCSFVGVSFAEVEFSDCTFTGCDLSNAVVNKTAFRTIRFAGCKMLGLNFEKANPFLFKTEFTDCNLSYVSFRKCDLRKTLFTNCRMSDADMTDCNVSGAVFAECTMDGTKFDNTNLSKADLRTAQLYVIDPERNDIKKAKFSLQGVPGLLKKYDIEIK